MTRQETKTGDAERSRFERLLTEERLTLQNSGAFIYDPRLVNFTLGGTFGLTQDRFSTDDAEQKAVATLSGYNLLANVLPEQALSLSLFANRQESLFSRELAGRSEAVSENRGATLHARRLWIPSSLAVRQERQEEESAVGAVIARRAERRQVLRYEGQRGWVDSEMGAFYEFSDTVDEILPALSFRSHDAQLNYSLDFGEELNRRWDSRLRLTSRTGLVESTLWTVDQSLRIEHTSTLGTDYRYSLVRSEARTAEITTHSAAANLRHRLWGSLTTTAGLGGIRQATRDSEKDIARGRLDLGYTRRLPLGGRLNVGLGGGLQYEDARFRTTEVSVSQEAHTAATPVALPIALGNPLVVISSVAVAKTAVGPLPAGCVPPPGPPTPLTAGVDYTLLLRGEITEIVPIPCAGATAGINPGDTIAVDYRFSVPAALTFTTEGWRADFGVDYPWARVFASHEESRQDLVAGRDGRFLDSVRSDGVGGELRWDHPRAHASLGAEARRYESGRTRYDTLRASALAQVTILPDLVLRVNADRTVTDFPDQDRRTQSISGRAGLSYTFGARLYADVSGGIVNVDDTLQGAQRTADARLAVRWLFRKIEVAPTVEYFERSYGDTVSKEYRAILRTIRRF